MLNILLWKRLTNLLIFFKIEYDDRAKTTPLKAQPPPPKPKLEDDDEIDVNIDDI